MRSSPCFNCPDRHTLCWDSCDRYKEFRAKVDAEVANAKKESQKRDDLLRVRERGMKRVGRKLWKV